MHLKCLDNAGRTADVVLITTPWVNTNLPLMAPASLKPAIEMAGYSSFCTDLNGEVYNLLQQHPYREQVLEFFFAGTTCDEIKDWVEDFMNSTVDQILQFNPKFVGLSLFTYASRSACFWICEKIKQRRPEIKIIVGGAGCLESFTGPGIFAEEMIALGLVDYHIRGDGEHALTQLLLGNDRYPGINSPTWKEITNEELHQLPWPNYDDYDFSQYERKVIGIHGSRGCVRACTFCDYIENWTKFQWRTAESIFEEMKTQYKKYGMRYFKFNDTLTNGNLKEFNKLIKLLANHNTANPDDRLHWGGYYIFREQSANDDEMWNTIKQSGASFLVVGIENLNEEVRYHIGKKFSNASIDYHLAQAKKHRIGMLLLFIVGYVTETQQHIDFSKKWLEDHIEFKDSIQLHWDQTLAIFPNTYLHRNKDQLGIKLGTNPHLWINIETGSDQSTRAQWIQELVDKSRELGYNILDKVDNHYYLEQKLSALSMKNL